jgi:sugar lactone lactonase YvrE
LVQGGFTALEGPVGAADGTVYFSDRMPDRTYHLRLDGKITVYQENTGAANGLAFTRDGDIVRAEGGAKRIGKVTRDGKVSVLTDSYNGKPLVSPNDLIVDAKAASTSPTPARDQSCRAARPMCITCQRAPRSPSSSTIRTRAPMG